MTFASTVTAVGETNVTRCTLFMKASAQLPIGEMNVGHCLEGEEVGYLRTAFVTTAHPIHASTLMIMRLWSNKKKKILPLKEVLAGGPPQPPADTTNRSLDP